MGRLRLRQGGCGHGITMLIVEAVGIGGGGRVEGLEGGEKLREMGGSGKIIGYILCFLFLQKFPILLAPLSSPPLAWLSHPSIEEAGEARRQGWDCPSRQ